MFRKIWIQLRSSLWFVPGLLVFVAIGLALGLVEFDVIFFQPLHTQSWQSLLNTGAEGARGMLTAIASSMITVAGVAFSVTIVILSLASTQYTPRILAHLHARPRQQLVGAQIRKVCGFGLLAGWLSTFLKELEAHYDRSRKESRLGEFKIAPFRSDGRKKLR
jgi:uncharacterized membrane protein